MALCLVFQVRLLVYALQYYGRQRQAFCTVRRSSRLLIISSVMLILVFGNLLQAALWALVFMLLGEFSSFSEAFYHSLVNFATLGYGDFVMSDTWKLLGPLEALNGILMVGVSTSALMWILQNAFTALAEHQAANQQTVKQPAEK